MKKTKKTYTIHKDLTVGEVVDSFPLAADILMGYGLHCVGCFANSFETLEQGVLGHGYTHEELGELIDDLNEAYEENEGIKEEKNKRGGKKRRKNNISKDAEKLKISVTEIALKKIKEIGKDEGNEAWPLRIDAETVGKKLKYSMNFIDPKETTKHDKGFAFGSVKVVVDKSLYEKLNGLEVDYLKEKDREGFKMNNPNISSLPPTP